MDAKTYREQGTKGGQQGAKPGQRGGQPSPYQGKPVGQQFQNINRTAGKGGELPAPWGTNVKSAVRPLDGAPLRGIAIDAEDFDDTIGNDKGNPFSEIEKELSAPFTEKKGKRMKIPASASVERDEPGERKPEPSAAEEPASEWERAEEPASEREPSAAKEPASEQERAEEPVFMQETEPVPEQEALPLVKNAVPWRITGELLRTYIACEDGGGDVWLIDKHAAHERINFDRMRSSRQPPMRQTLLTPVAAELEREDGELLLENLPLLEALGFLCEDFGDGTVLAREIPADLDAGNVAETLEELASDLRTGQNPEERRDRALRTMACKASIKGGWESDPRELAVLVEKVQTGEVRFCPHGRPVAAKLTRYDLEKMFKRA
ncbi:MAG: hypothetical protein IJT94_14770 [Oscillibacter sp.]|nr:hypothetical protein [Oscillibacter sp.]